MECGSLKVIKMTFEKIHDYGLQYTWERNHRSTGHIVFTNFDGENIIDIHSVSPLDLAKTFNNPMQ